MHQEPATSNPPPMCRWVFLDKIMVGLLFSWIALVAFIFYLRLGSVFWR